jgi:hypothetical protein
MRFTGDVSVKFAGKAKAALRLVCFSFIVSVSVAHTLALDERTPPADIPIESWLQRQDQNDFHWKVEVGQPYLTFQQRYVVSIVATFRANSLYKAGLSPVDLHFVTKFAGEDGRWLQGQSYSRFEPPAKLAGGDQIHSISSVYAKPGTYRVAVMAYDRLHGKGNVWRGTVRVPAINRDQLPGSDKNIPAIEFLLPVPPIAAASEFLTIRDPWDFGQGTLTIPVTNNAPLQVDLVANLSLSSATRMRHSEASEWFYQMNAARVTEISRVISEMDLKSGCMRLSAVDLPRQELFVDRVNTRDFDWSKIKAALQARERSKINVHTLAGEKKTPSFLATYLAKLAADPPNCPMPAGKSPVRVLIVVSANFIFPYGTEMVHLTSSNAWTRCYHLELVPVAGPHWDEISTLLKPLNPVRLETSTPAGFRKTLARLIRDLETMSGGGPPVP